jgi:hypothetical protein
VGLERSAWRMDDDRPAPVTTSQVIDSSKLTWDERQQLRSIFLKALNPATIAEYPARENE